MKFFKQKKPVTETSEQANLAEIALKSIHDGVVITDKSGVIKFINPAAATMTGYGSAANALGLDYGLVIKLESKEGRELSDVENPLIQVMRAGQALDSFHGSLIVGQSDKRIPIAISVSPAEGASQNRIITFRNITKELEEEGEQAEFVSTASHEMRTPVATIDGYLSLALNPQTANIDERARGYLTAAQAASKHLGKLFQDLLDVTKLDDGRIRPHFVPTEMVNLIEQITADYQVRASDAKLTLTFGSGDKAEFGEGSSRRISQVVYGFIDVDFMREIMGNLIDNAIKYTPDGGSIYVNVRGDGDRVLINVTDTGMGISSDDLAHIFQKFYRVDNSDTRTIGGTGLGLYLVKQRIEAMGGKVWAESAFGEGSTFYVSLPRLSQEEYDKRMIVVHNQAMQKQILQPTPQPAPQPVVPQPVTPATPAPQPAPQPVAPQPVTPATPAPQPAPQPVVPQPAPAPQPVAPQPTPQPVPQPAPQPVPQPTPAPQPVAPQPAPQPVPQPTPAPQPVAPQPVPQPTLQPTPAPQPVAPQPAPQPVAATPPAPPAAPSALAAPPAQRPQQIDINLKGETK